MGWTQFGRCTRKIKTIISLAPFRNIMDKEYKISFTCEYEYDFYNAVLREKWQPIVKELKGKMIKLSEIPDLVEKYGEVVLSKNEVEIYNDYRE